MQILGVDSALSNIFKGDFSIVWIIVITSTMISALILSNIFITAFRIKRTKFMCDTSIFPHYDLYFGRGKEIYEKSIYKIEDDLYEKLGKKSQKPKEIPIDCFIAMTLPGGFSIFLNSVSISGVVTLLLEKKELPQGAFIAVVLFSLLTLGTFILPIFRFRRRKKNGLI